MREIKQKPVKVVKLFNRTLTGEFDGWCTPEGQKKHLEEWLNLRLGKDWGGEEVFLPWVVFE